MVCACFCLLPICLVHFILLFSLACLHSSMISVFFLAVFFFVISLFSPFLSHSLSLSLSLSFFRTFSFAMLSAREARKSENENAGETESNTMLPPIILSSLTFFFFFFFFLPYLHTAFAILLLSKLIILNSLTYTSNFFCSYLFFCVVLGG